MRWFTRFLTLIFGLPLLCVVVYVGVYVAAVSVAAEQLPGWAQGPVWAWLLGAEQMTGSDAGSGVSSSPAGVGVGWVGYFGPGAGLPSGIPISGGVYITCDFHDANYTDHSGVDLVLWPEATLGVPVSATMNGKVFWAGWNGPWGNLVGIENDGVQIWLAHLDTIAVVEGQIVSSGEVVGTVGSTGNSTGPHLHYGIKLQTEDGQIWLDPLDYFGSDDYDWATCD